PTHVGMVHGRQCLCLADLRAPHARGDGPVQGCDLIASTRCSPRTWGWSGLGRLRSRLLLVLPTHVGMVRPPPEAPWRPPRAPHARGDGPTGEVEMGPVAPCSPRTWGWSAGGCAAVRAG